MSLGTVRLYDDDDDGSEVEVKDSRAFFGRLSPGCLTLIALVALIIGAVVVFVVVDSGGSSSSTESNPRTPTNTAAGTGFEKPALQVIGQFGPAVTGAVQLSVKVINTTSPAVVTYDFTGPGIESSETVTIPLAGTTFSIPATVDTGCPSPKQTWTATIVAIGGKPLAQLPSLEAMSNRSPLTATLGPCTQG